MGIFQGKEPTFFKKEAEEEVTFLYHYTIQSKEEYTLSDLTGSPEVEIAYLIATNKLQTDSPLYRFFIGNNPQSFKERVWDLVYKVAGLNSRTLLEKTNVAFSSMYDMRDIMIGSIDNLLLLQSLKFLIKHYPKFYDIKKQVVLNNITAEGEYTPAGVGRFEDAYKYNKKYHTACTNLNAIVSAIGEFVTENGLERTLPPTISALLRYTYYPSKVVTVPPEIFEAEVDNCNLFLSVPPIHEIEPNPALKENILYFLRNYKDYRGGRKFS